MGVCVRHVAITAVVAFAVAAAAPQGASAAPTRGDAPLRAAGASPSSCQAVRFTRTQARHVLRVTEARLAATNKTFRPGAFPSVTDQAGSWKTLPAQAWTSGFYPGSLWLAYRKTARPSFRTAARAWTQALAGQARDTSTHDIGFQIMSSFGNGYAVTHDRTYKAVIMRAAKSLATRYNPTVGAVRSWGARHDRRHFKVIIDNLMNLHLLFWASSHGGPRAWRHIATRHALTTAHHFLRPDGSTIHLVDFDPATGRVQGTSNPQGFSVDSTWSRGQAWATYGFTNAYQETGNRQFLAASRRVADYFIGGLRTDCVPYWDFDAPGIPDTATDTSAAAIAATGLLQLSRVDPNADRRARYARYASRILSSLADHYIATSGQATLTGSTSTFGVDPPDIGTAYGDYYLLQGVETWLRQHRP
jgi:unsaturated chondroitin disaccharide hydrolase